MLQQHFLLSFNKRRGRNQLPLRVNFIQVVTDDGRLVYHLTSRCLKCWDKTKWILLKEPFRFFFEIDVDYVMPEKNKTGSTNLTKSITENFMLWYYAML